MRSCRLDNLELVVVALASTGGAGGVAVVAFVSTTVAADAVVGEGATAALGCSPAGAT